MTWPQIQEMEEYRGRWVALDNCTYDATTAQPVEGSVVDADEDLVELCNRIRQSDGRRCAILYCGDGSETEPVSSPKAAMTSSRPYIH
jgi:hypothetical protein